MTPERWAKVKELFAAAVELPSPSRGEYLDRHSPDDELRREVESLLQAHEDAGPDSGAWAPRPEPTVIDNRYELIEMIGSGGMGRVYRARDRRLNRQVALKILAVGLADRQEYVRRFQRETRALSAVEHPNICRVYDAGFDQHPYLVMELLHGETVRAALARGPMAPADAIHNAMAACDALTAAWHAGFLHRDIKPGNLFLTAEGTLKVLDFGLAKRVATSGAGPLPLEARAGSGTDLTRPGQAPGTPSYMSPEQLRGASLDPRTDIYSLGVALYEMVAGTVPFRGTDAAEVATSILRDTPAPPSRLNPHVTPSLDRVILKAIAKEPRDRYASADAMRTALRALLEPGAAAEERKRRWRWWAAGGAAAAALLAGAAWLVAPEPAAPGPPPRLVPFTTFAGRKTAPSFSPAGDRVTYTWTGEQGAVHNIYVQMTAGGAQLRLTDGADTEQTPAWSPDGNWIAFRRSGAQAGYYVVPPLGGPVRKVADSYRIPLMVGGSNLCWSPDSRSLLIADQATSDGPLVLFLANIVSGEKRVVHAGPAYVSSPAWSPDGNWIAFAAGPSHLVHDIHILPAGGGALRRLTRDRRWLGGLAWMPSGRELIFSSSRAGLFSLWRISLSGGEPAAVAAVGPDAYSPVISRDGRRMAFVHRRNIVNLWRYEVESKAPENERARLLISSTRGSIAPAWSPDAARIAFSSERSGTSEIWVTAADGTGARQVTTKVGSQTGSPAWSPDGNWIAFDSRPEEAAAVFVIAADGSGLRQLSGPESDAYLPSWSRDGLWIYFTSERSGQAEVWRMPAAGGAARKMTARGGTAAQESPDGRWLYLVREGVLWRMPAAGGEESAVVNPLYWREYALGPQGLFFAPSADRGFEMIRMRRYDSPAAPVDVGRIGPRGAMMGAIAVSPDGRYLLYDRLDQVENDIFLVHNFR